MKNLLNVIKIRFQKTVLTGNDNSHVQQQHLE